LPIEGITTLQNNICGAAFHNSLERYPPPKCHVQTRKLVLQQILQWLEAPSQESILWLHGPAGSGKSAIAQTVAEYTENTELAASFFFSRGHAGRDTVQRLWATIAYRVAISIPVLRHNIGTAVMDNPDVFFTNVENQLQKLVVEPFRSYESQITDMPQKLPSLVIIDGLDECKGDLDQCVFLHSISAVINTHRLPFRFMITSRPEPHIRRAFTGPNLQHIYFRVILDDLLDPRTDIITFLRSEFERIHDDRPHTMACIPRPWPSTDVIQTLAERAGGQFIYAATALKFINDEDYRPTDQLQLVLDASNPAAFSDLDKLYQQILSTSTNIPLLLHILGCILVAQDTISTSEIEHILNLPVGDVHLASRRVHSILDIPDSPGDPIKIFHKSLPDFFFNPDRAGVYYISAQLCHLNMARGCLHWVKHQALNATGDGRKFWRHLPSGTTLVPRGIPRTYANRYWAVHCYNVEPPKEEISLLLLSLDDLSWSALLPYSGYDGDNSGKLHIAIKWLKVILDKFSV
jgi:NACHT domain